MGTKVRPSQWRDSVSAAALSAKLFEDNADPIRKATASAILSGGDIHNYHMIAHINGYALNVKRFLKYVENNHAPGLPTGTLFKNSIDFALVKAAIEAELQPSNSYTVEVQSASFYDLDLAYYAYYMMQSLGWPTWTQQSNLLIINGHFFNYVGWGDNSTSSGIPGVPDFPPTILYLYLKDASSGEVISLPLAYPTIGVSVHATYKIIDNPSNKPGLNLGTRYWVYTPDGTYSDIDDAIENTTPYGELFYPIIPIRIDGRMLSEKKHKDLYTTSARALKKLYLKMEDLQDALEGKNLEDEDEKPDMDDLDDAWLIFGLDIYTTIPESIEYLYRFFTGLHAMTPATKSAYEGSKVNILSGIDPILSFYRITEGQFNMRFQYNYTEEKPNQSGNLSEKYESVVTYLDPRIYIYGMGDPDPTLMRVMVLHKSYITLKKQNYDGQKQPNGTHDEIIIHGPVHISYVNASGHRREVTHVIEEKFIDNPAQAGSSGFYLPVSHVTLHEIHSPVDREIVLYDAMMLSVYAAHIEKLKWYQTGIFRIVLQIVMIVIAVVLAMNFGPAGLSLATAFMEAMIYMIIVTMVSIAVELLVQEVGGTLGTILAIVLIITMVYFGKIRFNLDTFKGLPWFEQLWKASQIFVEIGSKAMDVYVSSETMAIEEGYAELLQETEEKQAELDEAWNLLGPEGSPYDPLYVTQNTTMMNPNESPTDFYDRVLNIGNIVEISLDQCEDFVANALKLPEPDNSDYIVVH